MNVDKSRSRKDSIGGYGSRIQWGLDQGASFRQSSINPSDLDHNPLDIKAKRSKFSSKNEGKMIGNFLLNIAAMIQKKIGSRQRHNSNYYKRRRSYEHPKRRLHEDSESSSDDEIEKSRDKTNADDDMYLEKAEEKKRKQRKVASFMGDEALHNIVVEVLSISNIKEHIRNKVMQEFLAVKALKYAGQGLEGLMNTTKNPAKIHQVSKNKALKQSQVSGKTGETPAAIKTRPILGNPADGILATIDHKIPTPGQQTAIHSNRDGIKTPPYPDRMGSEELLGAGNPLKIDDVKLANAYEPRSRRLGLERRTVITKGEKNKMSSVTMQSLNIKERLDHYVPVALFLTIEHGLSDLGLKIIYYDTQLTKDSKKQIKRIDFRKLLEREDFIVRLVHSLVYYNEEDVFEMLLRNVPNWQVLFGEKIIDIYLKHNKLSYLEKFLTEFNNHLLLQNDKDIVLGTSGLKRTLVSKDKMAAIIKNYLQHFEQPSHNEFILDILKNLQYDSAEMASLLLMTGEADRITQIIQKNPTMVTVLDVKTIIEKRLYKVLIVFDPKELINIFNMPANPRSESSTSLYNELCNQIKDGEEIQSLCFLVLQVAITFWDFDKLWKFYQSLNEVLRNEGKKNWLAYVDNPLLFCMRLTYFFLKADRMLDVDSKEIQQLCDDLIKFCIHYIENASEETLVLNFFDRDIQGLDFFEYCFLVRKTNLLEIDFVANVIMNMWDLGRHSKSSFTDFFKLCVFKREMGTFGMDTFQKKYEMPIEDTDSFQLEYYLTSRSVYLSVLSDIIWPYSLIFLEFFFTVRLVALYLENGTDPFNSDFTWFSLVWERDPIFFSITIFLRLSNIVTLILRGIAMTKYGEMGTQVKNFHYCLMLLYAIQLGLYPILNDQFWILNNVQMLIVLTMIGYSFFLGLSLKGTGVILRIFARMVSVVVIFSMVSIVIITVIAYPVHTIFLDFTQVVDGFPSELNMFRSLYNGVLTLFEFVFGAVIFVRPYLEQNIYTVCMTLFMVIFSFFGNIMLANMLVAFLANQFNTITQMAKYYTLKMQYGLTKTLKTPDLDSIYAMPYCFNLILLPAYIFMICKGNNRSKINRFLKRFIHVINVFLPWFIYYTVYLLFLVVKRYVTVFFKIVLQAKSFPKGLLHITVWMVCGVPFLLKLFVEDIVFMCKRTLGLNDTEEHDLFSITLKDEEKTKLVTTFNKIYEVANEILRKRDLDEKEAGKGRTISLGEFIYELSRKYPKDFSRRRKRGEAADEDAEETVNMFNRNKYIFQKKYLTQGNKLYSIILKKFVSLEDRVNGSSAKDQIIDLRFLTKKFKNKVNKEYIHVLISFEKNSLEIGRKKMTTGDENELKADISSIKNKVEELNKDMGILLKLLNKSEGRGMKTEQM